MVTIFSYIKNLRKKSRSFILDDYNFAIIDIGMNDEIPGLIMLCSTILNEASFPKIAFFLSQDQFLNAYHFMQYKLWISFEKSLIFEIH